jgi:rhomboid protease GluP
MPDQYTTDSDSFDMPARNNRPLHPLERPVAPPPAPASVSVQPPMRRIAVPQHPPVLTYVLLAINIIAFGIDSLMGGQLTYLGAKINEAIVAGEYWRLVTPMFLHGGLLHIGFNSYFLYIIGPQIERTFGTWRFAAVYLLSGITGVMLSFAFSPVPSIGASSALFGLIGALLPFLYFNRSVLANPQGRMRSVIQVIVINLVIGFLPGSNIDNLGHLGGLLGGVILAALIAPRYVVKADFDSTPRVEDRSSTALSFVAIGGFAVALAAAFQFLLIFGSHP